MRDYPWAYEPTPDVTTPVGNMNTGYVTSTVSDAARWKRGEMPNLLMGPGAPGFLLPRPKWMREPGTESGTYPMAAPRDVLGNVRLTKASYNFAGAK